MWRKFFIVGLMFGISMIFLSTPIWSEDIEIDEDCVLADLEGNWKARAFGRVDGHGNTIWDEVDVEINSEGAVLGGKYEEYEFAQNYNPEEKPEIEKKDKYRITGGQLSIDGDCIITGSLDLSNGSSYTVEQGQILVKKDSPKELVLSNLPPLDDGDI